MIIQVAS